MRILVPVRTKIFILVFLLFQGFTCSLLSFESGDRNGGMRGLLLGFGVSSFAGSESSHENNKFIPGITLGFYQDFNINKRLGLETGLLFTTKGSRLDAIGDLYIHQVITYLELPVLGSWTLIPFEKAGVFLAGGTFFSLKLLAFNEVGFTEEIHRFDLGVNLGLGVKFQHVSYGIELKRGLLDIDKSETPADFKNLTVSLLARISF